jgi:hypothetical protein
MELVNNYSQLGGMMNFKKKQQGVVLIVALVFLIALTAVAAALMQMTTTDIKMSDASQEKVVATQEALSGLDESVFVEITTPGNTNGFADDLATYPQNSAITRPNTAARILSASPLNIPVDCPHAKRGWSVQYIKCNPVQVEVTKNYGRGGNSQIQVVAGVMQQVLSNN